MINILRLFYPILFLCLFVNLLVAQQLYPISEIEAVHGVEVTLANHDATIEHLTRYVEKSNALQQMKYVIHGHDKDDNYTSYVDAKTARVLSIKKNDNIIYRWDGPLIVGHRGNVKFTPENTLPALDKAIELGADLLEIDVRQTSDGVLVLMHDLIVDRTTDGAGPIANMTLAEVQELDAGAWFDEKFTGTRVPTLREALNHIRGRAIPDIDFKAGSPDELLRVLDEEGFLNVPLTIYSGSWALLSTIKQKTDKLLLRPTVPFGLSGLPILLQELDPSIININWDQFSERLVQSVHLSGKRSFLNTMQHDTEYGIRKMVQTMPDYIQSDHLDILVPILNENRF